MKTQSLIICACLLSLFFVSCTKDDTHSNKTNFLTKAPWILKKIEKKEPAGAYTDQPLHDCEKDDLLSFNKDHSYHVDIKSQCSAEDTLTTGTWLFSSSAEDQLTVIDEIETHLIQVQTLDDNSLIIVF